MTIHAITHARIYTIDPAFACFTDGTIVFDADGIRAVGPASEIAVPADARVLDGGGKLAVLPGLVDVHSHSSLLKGFSENAQLLDWLPVYQREHQAGNDDDAYHAALVSYLEALKGGTTTVADMFRRLHRAADAAEALGLRAHLVPYAADNPHKPFFETLETTARLIQDHHGRNGGRIHACVGLEHMTYCSPEMYREAARLADAHGVTLHTHTSEQLEEVDAVREMFGRRPIDQLASYGVLRPGTVLAHCVWLDDAEIATLAATGAGIAHCPVSNMKLASGTARLADIRATGIPVGLGSDGGISNNSLSMFECMKSASLLQKVTRLDATAVSAREALELATIRGAELLGVGERLGSLEPGKAADLITVDLWQPHLLPILPSEGHDPVLWNLVFAARASDVRDVWVDGEPLVAEGRVLRIDEDAALAAIHAQTTSLLERRTGAPALPVIEG